MNTKLKQYLVSRDISVTDFARKIGVCRQYMSLLVNGSRASLSLLMRIERATGGEVRTDDFIEEYRREVSTLQEKGDVE